MLLTFKVCGTPWGLTEMQTQTLRWRGEGSASRGCQAGRGPAPPGGQHQLQERLQELNISCGDEKTQGLKAWFVLFCSRSFT